jgi:hypothetical protein
MHHERCCGCESTWLHGSSPSKQCHPFVAEDSAMEGVTWHSNILPLPARRPTPAPAPPAPPAVASTASTAYADTVDYRQKAGKST